jgi:hypothetical protein
VPFFRLHDARYMVYWPYSTPGKLAARREQAAADEKARLELDARTIDQVAPGEQQPESDHFFKADGADAGINKGRHWRHATGWFSYDLTDKKREARALRLTYSTLDAGRRFDILVNGQLVAEVTLDAGSPQELYTRDYPIPPTAAAQADGKLVVKFVARNGSIAGGLYGLRLLRSAFPRSAPKANGAPRTRSRSRMPRARPASTSNTPTPSKSRKTRSRRCAPSSPSAST